jgi:hypothetical protein
MATYARIQDNKVAELIAFNPAGKFHSSIVWANTTGVSPAPEIGWAATETDGQWTFTPPAAAPAPTLADQARAALIAGCAVHSTAHPTLDGIYPLTDKALLDATQTSLYILINNKFPADQTEWPVLDINNQVHLIDDPQALQAAYTAVFDYAAKLKMIIAQGDNATGELPAQPVEIS